MRKHWLIALLALAVGVACGEAPETDAGTGGADTAAQAAMPDEGATGDAARSDVVYVDVRSDAEWAAGHVEGAIHIPHTEMAERYGELEQYRDKELVVYCRSGRRAGIAKDVLEEAGFDNVTNAGGLDDLQAEGVPVTR